MYVQDWLLKPTDWNWRLDPDQGGALRAVADIGTHWLDLTSFVTGKRIASVFADLHTVAPDAARPDRARSRRSRATRTTSSASTARSTTEDMAHVLLRFEDGSRGNVTVSQLAAGRKNSPRLRARRRRGRAGMGHRSGRRSSGSGTATGRTSSCSATRPSSIRARAAFTDYPGGHAEGFPDTFKQLYRAVYAAVEEGRMPAEPDFPTFADGHEEILLGEAIARSAAEERVDRRWHGEARLPDRGAARPLARPGRGLGGRARASSRSRSRAGPAAGESGGATRASRHIDVDSFDPGEVRDILDRHGLEISSLAYYPNNLHPDDAHREEVNGHLRKVVDAAAALGVEVVGTFVGNDKDRPLTENLERFRRIWPDARRATRAARA